MTAGIEPLDLFSMIARQAVDEHHCDQDIRELATVLTLLHTRQRPRIVLEIGGGLGGSAWAWQQLPSVKLVITVTLPERHRHWHCCTNEVEHRIVWGNSLSALTREALRLELAGRLADFLWIDGNHSYRIALADLGNYRPMCQPAALIGLHDTTEIPGAVNLEVHKLWAEIAMRPGALDLTAGPGASPGTGLILPDTPAWKDLRP